MTRQAKKPTRSRNRCTTRRTRSVRSRSRTRSRSFQPRRSAAGQHADRTASKQMSGTRSAIGGTADAVATRSREETVVDSAARIIAYAATNFFQCRKATSSGSRATGSRDSDGSKQLETEVDRIIADAASCILKAVLKAEKKTARKRKREVDPTSENGDTSMIGARGGSDDAREVDTRSDVAKAALVGSIFAGGRAVAEKRLRLRTAVGGVSRGSACGQRLGNLGGKQARSLKGATAQALTGHRTPSTGRSLRAFLTSFSRGPSVSRGAPSRSRSRSAAGASKCRSRSRAPRSTARRGGCKTVASGSWSARGRKKTTSTAARRAKLATKGKKARKTASR